MQLKYGLSVAQNMLANTPFSVFGRSSYITIDEALNVFGELFEQPRHQMFYLGSYRGAGVFDYPVVDGLKASALRHALSIDEERDFRSMPKGPGREALLSGSCLHYVSVRDLSNEFDREDVVTINVRSYPPGYSVSRLKFSPKIHLASDPTIVLQDIKRQSERHGIRLYGDDYIYLKSLHEMLIALYGLGKKYES